MRHRQHPVQMLQTLVRLPIQAEEEYIYKVIIIVIFCILRACVCVCVAVGVWYNIYLNKLFKSSIIIYSL